MTGLLILALLGLWTWLVFKFSRWVGGQERGGGWRWPIAVVVFAVLVPLPVIDELIARPQVEALCREGAVFKIDEQKIKGRRVKSFAEPLHAEVPGMAVPVTYTRTIYRDEDSGEELASRGSYDVKGGVLIRTLGASESNSPLFVREYCAPSEGGHEAANRLQFEIVKQLR